MMDTTQENNVFRKASLVNDEEIHKRYGTILSTLTNGLLTAVARLNMSRQFVLVAESCVLTANQPLRGSSGIEPGPPLLGDLSSVALFRIQCNCCVHICKRK